MHFVKEIVLFGAAAAFLWWCLESVITDGVAKAIEKSGLTRLDFETKLRIRFGRHLALISRSVTLLAPRISRLIGDHKFAAVKGFLS